MGSTKFGSKYILWEIAAVLAIWVISLWISYHPYNRALDSDDWLTAHTLVSLRALNDWGFFHLFGASALIPYSYEMQGADLTTFTKAQGIYLSYPSLWLIFPYAVFQFVTLFSPNYELTPAFIIIYNLFVNRLLCGVVVYLIFRYLLDYLFNDYLFYTQLSYLKQQTLAMIGLAGWMLTASAMDNTQNKYFSDQAILLPIYCLFLFALKHAFDFWNLRWLDRLILVALAFISVAIDWYGLVFLAVVFGSVTFITCINHNNATGQEIFQKIVLNVAMPLACGTAIALVFFLCQLIYFDDGFKQVVDTFTARTGEREDWTNRPLSLLETYQGIADHWAWYLPRVGIFAVVRLDQFLYIPKAATTIIFVLAPVLAWMSTSKARGNPNNYAAISLLYIAPCIQLILLKQHSYTHDFSAFKMALPISFSTCVLPVVYMIYIVGRLHFITRSALGAILVVLVCAYFIPLLKFSPDRTRNPLFKNIGVFVHQELPAKAIIFSQNLKTEPFGEFGPVGVWYTNRFVYSPETFASQEHKLQKNKVDGTEFLFIDYEDAIGENKIEPNIIKLCADKWFKYATPIGRRWIVGCNARELKFVLSN